MIGFLASYVYQVAHSCKIQRQQRDVASERIRKLMHFDRTEATRRLLETLPHFGDKHQIEILGDIARESSVNRLDSFTECVVDELQWICVLHEACPEKVPKSIRDRQKVARVTAILREISANAVEYRRSRRLVQACFQLAHVLLKYSTAKRYHGVVAAIVDLYHDTGVRSLRIVENADHEFSPRLVEVARSSLELLDEVRMLLEGSGGDRRIARQLAAKVEEAYDNLRVELGRFSGSPS